MGKLKIEAAMNAFDDDETEFESEAVEVEGEKRGRGAPKKDRTHKISVYLNASDFAELGFRKTQANKHSKKRITTTDIVTAALRDYFARESNQSQ